MGTDPDDGGLVHGNVTAVCLFEFGVDDQIGAGWDKLKDRVGRPDDAADGVEGKVFDDAVVGAADVNATLLLGNFGDLFRDRTDLSDVNFLDDVPFPSPMPGRSTRGI